MAAENADSPLKKKVYILPTGFGLVYGASLFLMLLLAYTYQSNLAYALTFFLMSFGLVVMLVTHRVVSHLKVREKFIAPVYAGRVFPPPLIVEEGGELDGAPEAVIFRPVKPTNLRAGEKGWRADERGIFALSRVEVRSLYPLGLFQAWKRVPVNARLVVAAAPIDHALRSAGGGSGGEEKPRASAEPREIGELAAGRPEDPPSSIDWRSMARGRGWQKKIFLAPGQRERRVSWEETESLQDTEKRLQQMSAWILAAQEKKLNLSVELPDGRQTTSLNEALTALAAWRDPS
ncbi:MAG: hypothetical protein KF802_10000 [Bdellovibrionaceae bacterium]|nr:hypothetical protein [Pseudobdellovibrionaceae bacterium]MBX3033743.1 hypothetical protein [Pseudobdellovibrionaceae bacterium]